MLLWNGNKFEKEINNEKKKLIYFKMRKWSRRDNVIIENKFGKKTARKSGYDQVKHMGTI